MLEIKNKKISIILPVYNGEKYLKEALDSIIKQSYDNFELIVVDDCSTDHTEEIVKKYAAKDNRIRIIKNERNLKLPKTLNVGFNNATGDYLTWTSDDNKYKPNALEKMARFLNKHSDTDMVYADYTEINSQGEIIRVRQLEELTSIGFKNVIGACFLYRKEIAKKVGEYDAELFLAEDYDYWIRISKLGKIRHIHENLYFYRQHETSLTSCKCSQAVNQTYKVIEKHFLYLFSLMSSERERKKFLKTLEYWGQNQDHKKVQKAIISIRPSYKLRFIYKNGKQSLYYFGKYLLRR